MNDGGRPDSEKPTDEIGPPRADPTVQAAKVPPSTRMAYEVPRPKNWPDFQRACVVLYQAELNDPHAQEYGRGGQSQRGIDIIARRDGRPDHFVGVQCRRVVKPLGKAKIMADCRAALAIEAGIKEIIFATTAPDDTKATDAAIAVEKDLRAEGHDVIVALYGWESLQTRIALHSKASAVFNPALYANTVPEPVTTSSNITEMLAQLGEMLARGQKNGISLQPADPGTLDKSAEDPALHGKIDLLRDLFQKDHQTLLAERQLLDLLSKTSAEDRPWARFRLEINLGSIAMELGREAEAAWRFESAHALRPEDGNALANLALARTIQGKPDEAMGLARRALEAEPRAEVAIAYLLQAAARSTWQGDPEDLIPVDLKDHVAAVFGLAEYLRRRDVPDWAERTIALAARHPDSEELKRSGGLAVLELAIRDNAIVTGGSGAVSMEQINRAADDLKVMADRCIASGFSLDHDLLAHVSNAAVLLRIADRDAEAEALLLKGIPLLPNDPSLRRLLALAQTSQGHRAEAIKTLAGCDDAEAAMLRAEMVSIDDPEAGLAAARAVVVPAENEKLARLRWRMLGEVGLRLRRRAVVDEAVAGLRASHCNALIADLLEVRAGGAGGAEDPDGEERTASLLALADRVGPETDLIVRFELAEALMRADEPDTAVFLLADHVDLSRSGPGAALYLQCLAAARHDEAFDRALARAAPALRDDPEILWTRTARAWNMGDLADALYSVEQLISMQPENGRARLLKIDILARGDRTAALLAELEKPIESLPWERFKDRARIAGMLAHFGQLDRAIALAYRLYLEHRDLPRAWLTLSGIVMEEGRSLEDRRWEMAEIGNDAAIDVEFDDGEKRFFVVEPDPALRKIDQESFEPDHALVQRLMGLGVGATFADTEGRTGTIRLLRHKYVARFHYILEHFQTRFPEASGFRRVALDLEGPDGAAPIREMAKARQDWIEEEQQHYVNGNWPLGLLAYRVGADVIEVAAGVAASGHRLKVAIGSNDEVVLAAQELEANETKGCTLDLLTFWTAWRLGALDALYAAFGHVYVCQSVVDRLLMRRGRFESAIPHGMKWGQYDDGRLLVTEVTPDAVTEMRDDVSAALNWLDAHGAVRPVVANDAVPTILRQDLRRGRSDLFDCIVLAIQTDTVLICDDLFTREFMGLAVGRKGAWLQIALRAALSKGTISIDDYVRWTVDLVEAGQSYLGVDGNTLARAAALDAEVGPSPGRMFDTLTGLIGGAIAEPRSHIVACLGALQLLWNDPAGTSYRQPVTGHLLRQLLRERTADYGLMLRLILMATRNAHDIQEYIYGWMRGHFVPMSAVIPTPPQARARSRRRTKR